MVAVSFVSFVYRRGTGDACGVYLLADVVLGCPHRQKKSNACIYPDLFGYCGAHVVAPGDVSHDPAVTLGVYSF